MDDHDDRDDEAEPAADDQAGRKRHPVEEAVDAHPARTDDTDVPMGGVAMVQLRRSLVPDVDGRQLLDGVEGEEAERGGHHGLVEVAAEQTGRLGDQVEERSPDPDPGADGDDHPDVADRAQRDEPAEEGRDEGRGRDDERGDRHQSTRSWAARQAGQTPEQLEAMLVDPEAGLAGDVTDHPPQAGVVDLGRPAAA